MRAIIWTEYGPPEVLKLREIEKPAPKAHEVLIRICATTVTAGDCEMRSLKLPMFLSFPMRLYAGITRPQRITILGQELAGIVESVGQNVTRFREGDQVFAVTGIGTGTYAEYICLPEAPGDMEGVLAIKPHNMTFAEAAAVPTGGLEALHFLRKAQVQRGQRVLINGAGGSIGTFGVQIAKNYGAEVTAVDSTDKLDMLRALGADHTIDYTQEDFTQSGQTYHVIFDVVGKSPFSGSLRSLTERGIYLIANPRPSLIWRSTWTRITSHKKVIYQGASHRSDDLTFLKELIEAGKIRTVIDRHYPLEQTAAAHRYVETGQKAGNVVIAVGCDDVKEASISS